MVLIVFFPSAWKELMRYVQDTFLEGPLESVEAAYVDGNLIPAFVLIWDDGLFTNMRGKPD